jgi:hypothetical protein
MLHRARARLDIQSGHPQFHRQSLKHLRDAGLVATFFCLIGHVTNLPPQSYILAKAVWREASLGGQKRLLFLRLGARVVHDNRRPRVVK